MSTTTLVRGGLLTTQDLARAVKRTDQTVRAWVREGLPAHRLRGRLMFDPTEVDAWLRARNDDGGEFTADDIDEHIVQLVNLFPPLTETQIERVSQLLRASR
ncbi:helix-turn-helix domain-containing protein [Mycobacterium sp. 4D054]|uniref:helix-turn-helix domain-containing protein n=1 Tax=Mycobacterium sp. 4D054 TaxID=3457440 RepID=UPI003FD1EEA8